MGLCVISSLRRVLIAGLLLSWTFSVRVNAGLSDAARAGVGLAAQADPASGASPSFLYRDLFPTHMQFEQISVKEGLSNASVYAIMQDRQGFMWFGTEDGLNKYDGHTFTVYKHDPDDPGSLSNNAILAIYEDRSGTLWVATFGGGLNRFEPQTDTFAHYRHDAEDPQSISSDYAVRVREDRQGFLWITTEGGGLNRFDPATETFSHYRHDANDPTSISHDIVTRVLEDSHGDLWVGTDGGGLNRLDRETGTFTHYRHEPNDPTSLSNDVIWSIVEDRQGVLWIATFGGGINRYDRQKDHFIRYQHDANDPNSLSTDDARLIYEDSEGVLWVGTLAGGLNRFDRESGQFSHIRAVPGDEKSLQSDTIWSLYEDRSGVLWVGTLGAGLHKYTRRQERFVHVSTEDDDPRALGGNGVVAFAEDEAGNLWVATSDGGLERFDPQSGTFNLYGHDPENAQSIGEGLTGPIVIDTSGMLWVGTFGNGISGLDLTDEANLNPQTAQFIRVQEDAENPGNFHDVIWSLHADGTGTLWVGTQTGLDARRAGTDRVIHYRHDPNDERSLSNDVIRTIFEDSRGRLWLGTDIGLNYYDRESGTFTRYQHDPQDPNSLSTNVIFAIHEDQSGILWLGTWGGGLNRFDVESKTFTRYTEKDGLANDSVFDIVEDDTGNLWLSTGRGLSRFDPEAGSFSNYDDGDGLYGLATGVLFRSRTGELLVADGSGFTIVDPHDLDTSTSQPPVVLTSLSQGGEEIPLTGADDGPATVTLRWPQNFFEFEYAVLDYVRPDRNEFAYMLEGFDSTWNEMGSRRFGRYTNLPGGRYTLRVRGSNSDGVWNEEGIALPVTVVPPFWATGWFRILVALVVVGGAATGYSLRLRSLSGQRRQLEAEVASRTRELDALYAVAAEASRSVDLQQILSASLEKTLAVMAADAGGVYLLTDEGILALTTHKGLSPEVAEALDHLQVGEGFNGRVVERGEPLVVGNLAADPRLTRQTVAEAGFQSGAVVPLVSRGRNSGSLFVITCAQRTFSADDLELLTSIGRQLGGVVTHARLFAAEIRRAEQFRVINEVSQRITAILDIDRLLEEIVRLIQQTFGYYHVAIGLIEGDEVVYRVGAGELWDDNNFNFRPSRLKVGREGLSGWVAGHGEPLVVPDVSQEPRYVWMEGSHTRSELIVPVEVRGEVVAVLDAQSDRLNAFDEIDRVVLQLLAHQAGTAIENARLYGQARQLAVVEERSRLARDLHDAVTQSVYSLTLLAEAGKRMIAGRDMPEVESNQTLIGDIAQQTLQEMRLLVYQLRPSELGKLGLVGTLEQRLEVVERRAGIEARLGVEGEGTLPYELEEQLYRIAQEALNNALKHAQATAVEVMIRFDDGKVSLTVKDDGRGFEPLALGEKGGLGLPNMSERARKMGGLLTVQAAPGEGVTVHVEIPLESNGENEAVQRGPGPAREENS